MFRKRLIQIIESLNASSAEIARFAQYDDTSNISRLVSGARIPKNNGIAARRLIKGIYLFADDKNRIPELCKLISCDGEASSDEIKSRLMSWLFEGVKGAKSVVKSSAPVDPQTPFRSFGEKLNTIMDMAELSNVRLGKLLNLDASYISRFRNGFRSPRSNPQIINAICSTLVSRLREQGRMKALGRIAGIQREEFPDEELCIDRFRAWLCDFETEDNSFEIERLIESISSFPASPEISLPAFEEIAIDSLCNRSDPIYFGTEGLKEAVIRFLGNAIRDGVKEMWLYSDQSMGWMVDDAEFHLKWASLMRECVRNGIRICIIHNIDRGLGEMLEAINSWLPLYMSGMIESWYNQKQHDNRFSHTLFLCPGYACIEACNVSGYEHEGIYRYHADANMVRVFQNFYNALLTGSKRLVHIMAGEEFEKNLSTVDSGITILNNTLSLATMTKRTLLSILERSPLDDQSKALAISQWEGRTQVFKHNIEKGFVHECVPAVDDETLFAGKARVDGLPFTYSPQEYAEHIQNIISLSETCANYRFYVLPDAPFADTKILFTEKTISVIRLNKPHITFTLTHPAMCAAFSTYINRLKDRYGEDKLTQKRRLQQYF